MNEDSIQDFESAKKLEDIDKVILVGSGKGGVGKSFVAAGLALALSARGFQTGILDYDIHGASLPNYLGIKPPLKSGRHGIEPKLVGNLKVMSIALLTGDNTVPLRGEKKPLLLSQLFSLTDWGKLDYLVIDLPPSTGDEILSTFEIFARKCTLVLVTTPSPNAVNVVYRLRQLAESEGIPIEGVVVNMAQASIGRKRIELFGKLNSRLLERKLSSSIIAKIPFEPRVNYDSLKTLLRERGAIALSFQSIIEKTAKNSKD